MDARRSRVTTHLEGKGRRGEKGGSQGGEERKAEGEFQHKLKLSKHQVVGGEKMGGGKVTI